MKIIGTTEDGLLLSAGARELVNLTGFYSSTERQPFKPGDEIHISAMYQQLYKLAAHEADLNKVADTLEHCARLVKLVNPVSRVLEQGESDG